MQFENHQLSESLSEHIQAVFYYKGYSPEHSIERVVPTGHIFIIFELDGITRHTYDNESLEPNGSYQKVWISGMHKDQLSISAHDDSEMLVIQFKTSGAYPIIHIPIDQLNNKVISAEKILGEEILRLRSKILTADGHEKKFNLVQNWLNDRLDPEKTPPKEAVEVLSLLQSQPVNSAKDIINNYPNTQKHLIHQFRLYFGQTPKVFHRIFRFNSILQQIQNKDTLSWSQIAYEFGYTDQSHFIKEFKAFSGFNPQQYLKHDYHKGETNFFPVDK